ncbi:MAG TPA: enoyl-CoA hydratase [Spirochaetota bacterium]|nr:enoyl-CoA hydratase [Spirochaetota bacterium]HPS87187.1 enoyl-CoA hydratase [Spirochaetota bacterium]
MEEKQASWIKKDGICTITMNSPKTLNALSENLTTCLEEAFEDCFDESIRAVVLTGSGKAFCAGGDLQGMLEMGAPKWLQQVPKKLAVVISAIRSLPKPVIAAVNGPAMGVGMSVAMACDLRIASDRASFVQSYTSVGLSPDGAWSLTVPRIIGLSKAMEMLLLDTPVKAEEALRLGMVSMVVTAESFLEETEKLAMKLAAGPTMAFARGKQLINRSLLRELECQMENERQSIMAGGASADFAEGADAVFKKRKPEFTGR